MIPAVANVPTGVDVEIHEVRETEFARRSSSFASRQSFELGEIDRFGSSGLEIGIEEGGVAHFIQRVARDILRAIGIQVRKGNLIRIQWFVRVDLDRRKIADSAQFRILRPKV